MQNDQTNTQGRGSERRRAGRVRCSGTRCQFGPIVDFSRTGIKVVTKKAVKVPEGKSVNLQIDAVGARMVVPGRVVNNRRRADGQYETGFAFVGVDERWTEALAMMARIASADCEIIHQLKFAS